MRGRGRDLGLVASGAGVSLFGTALTLIVLLLHVKDSGAMAVMAVLVAEFVPVTVGAPLAGLVVDRFPNRRVMIIGQVGQAAAVVGVLAALGSLPWTLVMLVVLGCGTAVVNPAGSALVPVVCGEDGAARGYAWVAAGRGIGMLAGSAVGGVLVAALGTRGALVVDAGTYLGQAALLTLVRAERDPRTTRGAPAPGAAMAGVRHVLADPVLRVSVVSLALASAGVMFAEVATVFYVVEVLGGGAATLGLLHACWMVGVLAGVRFAARLRGEQALLSWLGIACCVIGAAMLVPAVLPYAGPVAAGYVLGGIANGVQNVANQGLVRVRTPDALRGRVFAAAGSVLIGTNILGTVLGGGVTALLGPQRAFGLAGCVALSAGVLAVHALRAVGAKKPAPAT